MILWNTCEMAKQPKRYIFPCSRILAPQHNQGCLFFLFLTPAHKQACIGHKFSNLVFTPILHVFDMGSGKYMSTWLNYSKGIETLKHVWKFNILTNLCVTESQLWPSSINMLICWTTILKKENTELPLTLTKMKCKCAVFWWASQLIPDAGWHSVLQV